MLMQPTKGNGKGRSFYPVEAGRSQVALLCLGGREGGVGEGALGGLLVLIRRGWGSRVSWRS